MNKFFFINILIFAGSVFVGSKLAKIEKKYDGFAKQTSYKLKKSFTILDKKIFGVLSGKTTKTLKDKQIKDIKNFLK